MESSKQQVGSDLSLTDDLFGAKDSTQPSNSSGIFSSISPPLGKLRSILKGLLRSKKALGKKSPTSDLMGSLEKHSSGGQAGKKGLPDVMPKSLEWGTIFQDRVEPCLWSSSLYYGAQEDMYIKSSGAQSLGSLPNYKKKEDDPNGNNLGSAPEGNWWDGSVYY